MSSDKLKFYIELTKTLTAFILGTGAGIYAIVLEGKVGENYFFLIFISILCMFSMGSFIALFVYIDKNT